MTYTAWIILTASLVGMSCGLIGVFLILRKMAMMADAISHTVLLGIVIAFIITRELSGMHMLVGAIFAGILTALLVQWLHSLRSSARCFYRYCVYNIICTRRYFN